VTRRSIPFGVLFTQTHPASQPKTQAFIEAAFKEKGEPVFDVQLFEREAFRAMFSFGGSLAGLKGKGVGGLAKAIENADAFVDEFLARAA
jgi:chromosome partitioning protein